MVYLKEINPIKYIHPGACADTSRALQFLKYPSGKEYFRRLFVVVVLIASSKVNAFSRKVARELVSDKRDAEMSVFKESGEIQ